MSPSIARGLLNTVRNSGWISENPESADPTLFGLPNIQYSEGSSPTLYVGVDLGGTKMHAAAILITGSYPPVLVEDILNTDARGGQHLVDQISNTALKLAQQAQEVASQQVASSTVELEGPVIHALALGCPGVLDPSTGFLSEAPHLPGWDALDVPGALKAGLNCAILIENDVDIAALGEQLWTGTPDLAFIALGTGIGMGLVLNGELRRGAYSRAGEICHLPLGGDPFDLELQKHGVLESRLSGAGLINAHTEAGGTAPDVYELFEQAPTSQTAQATIESTASLLALTIRTISAVVDPAEFVLGGGIGARPELLHLVRDFLARTAGGPIEVRTSTFGARAGIAGALAAALSLDPETTCEG